MGDRFFFLLLFPFSFSFFPFSVLFPGPKHHHPVDRYPIPADYQLSNISRTPSEEALQIKLSSLERSWDNSKYQ